MENKLNFKTEEEMQEELKERISSWKKELSKDGYIIKGDGVFDYKKIKYSIKILRYYNHTDRFTSMSSRISDCHCVVEYPDETKELIDAVKELDHYSEFLWHDTLHSWNDNQTVEEQIRECHNLAKEDIDSIPTLINKIKEKVWKLNKVIMKLNNL